MMLVHRQRRQTNSYAHLSETGEVTSNKLLTNTAALDSTPHLAQFGLEDRTHAPSGFTICGEIVPALHLALDIKHNEAAQYRSAGYHGLGPTGCAFL